MKKMTINSTVPALLLAPLSLQAIELTEYQNPVSQYEEAFMQGNLNTKSGNQDQTSYDLNLLLDWESVYSSLPRTIRLQADGQADISRGGNDTDERQENSSANASGNVDTYFNNDNRWFWFGSGELGYLSDAVDDRLKVGAGVGYGRVINATPLAKVLRIEEELREHGVIIGDISDEVYLELAQIIDRESEFKSKFGADEYKSSFFAAFEEELKKAGVLKEGALGATGALNMSRVLYDEPISVRKHGWVVRGGAGVVIQDFNGNADNDPSIDAEFEYAKPNGYNGQFVNLLSYSTVFADDTDQQIGNRMTYTHEVSDRVDWINSWALDYLKSGNDAVEDIFTNAAATSYRYYLTNTLSAGATLSVSRVDDNIDNNGNDDTDVATFFDLRYRLK